MTSRTFFIATLLLALSTLGMADETLTRGNNLAVDVSSDGRLAMDLSGDLWIVPLVGGDAQRMSGRYSGLAGLRMRPALSSARWRVANSRSGCMTSWPAKLTALATVPISISTRPGTLMASVSSIHPTAGALGWTFGKRMCLPACTGA